MSVLLSLANRFASARIGIHIPTCMHWELGQGFPGIFLFGYEILGSF